MLLNVCCNGDQFVINRSLFYSSALSVNKFPMFAIFEKKSLGLFPRLFSRIHHLFLLRDLALSTLD